MDYTTTRLLTLLNVSAVKAGKRKRYEDSAPTEKLNKRKPSTNVSTAVVPASVTLADTATLVEDDGNALGASMAVDAPKEENVADDTEDNKDPYESHYGPRPKPLTTMAREAVDRTAWNTARAQCGRLGTVVDSVPEGSSPFTFESSSHAIPERIKEPFVRRQVKLDQDQRELQNDLLSVLSSQRDLYLSRTSLETQRLVREAVSLHALNHITKKRRRVLKNNERIVHHAKSHPDAPALEDVQDQGFTRPSVLILLPFRNSALAWINALTSHTPAPSFQVENRARFDKEFGLPAGSVDKLASAEPGTYPRDHVETFKGNVDDSFRVGVKLTRKSVKLFSEFYGSDLIIASPLGLRMSIEKEKSADFLSSIEVLIVDQMDALTMQNWEHVQFVFSSLNKMPKESHDADFSRIKPWYLDGHAAYLRQSILLSAYETPEIRAIYNGALKNVAGKLRTERRWAPISVPEGIQQNFVHFHCTNSKDEAEKRFTHFTRQLLPAVLKSAVQSANTVVFVPSSFDFIRVHNYFRKEAGVSFSVLSEYSTNQDISRARQAFFSGSKAFLLVSERFHYFRRYKLRGIRNVIFYAPPDHPQFFTELLSYPFLDDDVEPADVTCRVLYSKYDWFRLERIAGSEGASEMVKSDAAT